MIISDSSNLTKISEGITRVVGHTIIAFVIYSKIITKMILISAVYRNYIYFYYNNHNYKYYHSKWVMVLTSNLNNQSKHIFIELICNCPRNQLFYRFCTKAKRPLILLYPVYRLSHSVWNLGTHQLFSRLRYRSLSLFLSLSLFSIRRLLRILRCHRHLLFQ